MTVEAGSTDCRVLIEAKRSIEDALRILADLPSSDHLRRQLLSVYNQLEGMHDLKRAGGAACPSDRLPGVRNDRRPAWLNWVFLAMFLWSGWQVAGSDQRLGG